MNFYILTKNSFLLTTATKTRKETHRFIIQSTEVAPRLLPLKVYLNDR